jgi:hypothetical protein
MLEQIRYVSDIYLYDAVLRASGWHPQFIVMMEDAQKKAKRAGMPIAEVKLVMMASAGVLAA